jgi:hypothetical protein
MNNLNFFKNKKLLIAGYSKFKGSRLVTCLDCADTKTIWISLANKNINNHYNLAAKNLISFLN